MDGYKKPLDPNKTYSLFARLGAFIKLSGEQLQRSIDGGEGLSEEELADAFVCFASESYIPESEMERLSLEGYDVPDDELTIAYDINWYFIECALYTTINT